MYVHRPHSVSASSPACFFIAVASPLHSCYVPPPPPAVSPPPPPSSRRANRKEIWAKRRRGALSQFLLLTLSPVSSPLHCSCISLLSDAVFTCSLGHWRAQGGGPRDCVKKQKDKCKCEQAQSLRPGSEFRVSILQCIIENR